MKQLILSLLVALLILPGPSSRAAAPKPGETAPPLRLTGLLQAPGKLAQNLKSVQGKVVVLEFWATWCAPCIAAMPHLNGLAEKYKNQGVQFISITDETTEKATRFLQKRPINGWVGIDGDNAMNQAYEVQAIPLTVVIGPNGKVLGYPKSTDLSEQLLAQALAGQLLAPPIAEPVATAPLARGAEPAAPLYELSIRPSASPGMATRMGPRLFKTTGITAQELIRVAFEAEQTPLAVTAALPEGTFDVVATNAGKSAPDGAWRAPLQVLLKEVWGIAVYPVQQDREVYELVTTPAAGQRLAKAEPGEADSRQSADEGILAGHNTPLPVLAKILQEKLSIPVVNATNLTGNYDYNLSYDESKPETLLQAVEKDMGLKLRKVRRPLEVLMVVPRPGKD